MFASLLEVWIELLKQWGRSIDLHQIQVNCLLVITCKISLPVIQIWSSHFCLAIIVWESIVANSCILHWHETGFQTFRGRPSSSHIDCSDLCLYHYWKFGLSYWSIEEDWLILHQVQVDCLLDISCKISLPVIQTWSSHFCLAIKVWESVVANSCIWHWHETGLQTFKGRPSSSHIGCLDLCVYHYWKFGLSYWSIEVNHQACRRSLLLNFFYSRRYHFNGAK